MSNFVPKPKVARDTVKIHNSGSNFSINLHKAFVKDSNFPFSVGEYLTAVIDGDRLVISKAAKI